MKYLLITLHDNDFFYELQSLGNILLYKLSDEQIDAESIITNNLKCGIVTYLTGVYAIRYMFDADDLSVKLDHIIDYFYSRLKVKIVDESEIEMNCNSEMLYVPLCTSEDINHGVSYFIT